MTTTCEFDSFITFTCKELKETSKTFDLIVFSDQQNICKDDVNFFDELHSSNSWSCVGFLARSDILPQQFIQDNDNDLFVVYSIDDDNTDFNVVVRSFDDMYREYDITAWCPMINNPFIKRYDEAPNVFENKKVYVRTELENILMQKYCCNEYATKPNTSFVSALYSSLGIFKTSKYNGVFKVNIVKHYRSQSRPIVKLPPIKVEN